MVTLTTISALKKLLTDDAYLNYFLKSGYTKQDRQRFIFRLQQDQLTTNKIEEILLKCGFTVAIEKKWHLPDQ